MKISEIGLGANKDERIVKQWAKNAVKNLSVIKSLTEKINTESKRHPANYTLEETCLIIEAGMGKEIANNYRINTTMANILFGGKSW
jgi:hypothetical protein